jgi:hypothetical protein
MQDTSRLMNRTYADLKDHNLESRILMRFVEYSLSKKKNSESNHRLSGIWHPASGIEAANLTNCCQITVYEIIHRNEF